MQVGTIVKSFDFPGIADCYMIGKVVDIIHDYILCDTIKIVWEGTELPIKESKAQFRTVRQGLVWSDEKFQRVVELG